MSLSGLTLVFLLFGFVIGFLLKKSMNIAILCVFFYAGLKAIDMFGLSVEWDLYKRLTDLLTQVGKTMVEIITHAMQMADIAGAVAFLFGGVVGILWRNVGNH